MDTEPTTPPGSTATARTFSFIPNPWTTRPRSSTARPSARGRSPRRRSRTVVATATGGERQVPAARTTHPFRPRARPGDTLLPAMAKNKRRKLRARRSKANHGRRPNARRG
jgi:hypothetical protein